MISNVQFRVFLSLSPLELASRSATKEFSNISWNPKVHCRVCKSLSLFPTLSQMNAVYNTPSYSSVINSNIILPSTSTSS
jgi:hypothetical protein